MNIPIYSYCGNGTNTNTNNILGPFYLNFKYLNILIFVLITAMAMSYFVYTFPIFFQPIQFYFFVTPSKFGQIGWSLRRKRNVSKYIFLDPLGLLSSFLQYLSFLQEQLEDILDVSSLLETSHHLCYFWTKSQSQSKVNFSFDQCSQKYLPLLFLSSSSVIL